MEKCQLQAWCLLFYMWLNVVIGSRKWSDMGILENCGNGRINSACNPIINRLLV